MLGERVYKFSIYLLLFLVSVMVLSVCIQVINRNSLQFSLFWLDEIARFSLVWATFIGASIALKDKELIALDLISNRLSSKAKKVFDLIIEIIVFLFILVLFYYSIKLMFDPSVLDQRSSALRMPQSFVYLSIPVSMLFMAVYTFSNITQTLEKGGNRK